MITSRSYLLVENSAEPGPALRIETVAADGVVEVTVAHADGTMQRALIASCGDLPLLGIIDALLRQPVAGSVP